MVVKTLVLAIPKAKTYLFDGTRHIKLAFVSRLENNDFIVDK
jgi:hypothetical protein